MLPTTNSPQHAFEELPCSDQQQMKTTAMSLQQKTARPAFSTMHAFQLEGLLQIH